MNNEIVLIVDDDEAVCASTARLLRSAGYQVRTFQDTQQLFAHGRPKGPCCLILDVQIPGEDGLQFQRKLIAAGIRVPIIFISGQSDIPVSVQAMKAGAMDFLPKPFEATRLLKAVSQAIGEDTEAMSANRHLADVQQNFRTLTARECEVFAAVTAGSLNKQIAYGLGVVEKTVKVHRARVMEKMHAESLADLVRMADLLNLKYPISENHAASEASAVGLQ